MKMDTGSFEKINHPGILHSLILDQISGLIEIFRGVNLVGKNSLIISI